MPFSRHLRTASGIVGSPSFASLSLNVQLPKLNNEKEKDLQDIVVSSGQPKTEVKEEDQSTTIWGFCVDQYPPRIQFLILVTGVFVNYLFFGYMQELIFRQPGFKFGTYLTFFQFALYAFFAFADRKVVNEKGRKAPLSAYVVLTIFLAISHSCSNASLALLNYPTQVLFKSSKVIPVMLMSTVIMRKRYRPAEYLCTLGLVVGLCVFLTADISVAPNFDPTGVVLVCIALCADAFIGNLQERTMTKYGASQRELALYSDFIGACYVLCLLPFTPDFGAALVYTLENPRILLYIALFGFLGYSGILFVLSLVKKFGAFYAVTVTSVRKAFTVILSFLLFPKPLRSGHLLGGFLVFACLAFQIYVKNKDAFHRLFRRKFGITQAKTNIV
eukprot:GCRY01000735.1.p1 GENE.GCRY01000735.1~~GCRY01000735.1.p1  ORF type:complete len:388 (+),score=93.35 GCRY01000735.1:157-1320(+)